MTKRDINKELKQINSDLKKRLISNSEKVRLENKIKSLQKALVMISKGIKSNKSNFIIKNDLITIYPAKNFISSKIMIEVFDKDENLIVNNWRENQNASIVNFKRNLKIAL